MSGFSMDDYVDVAERIHDFKEAFPEGSLRPADPTQPYRVETVGDKTFIVYAAAAYRNPNDPAPGIGVAWEPFPGKSNYTRDSELQNAETSAWGRAIIAVLASTSKRIASRQEVRNRREDEQSARSAPADSAPEGLPAVIADLLSVSEELHLDPKAVSAKFAEWHSKHLTVAQAAKDDPDSVRGFTERLANSEIKVGAA